MPKLEEVLGWPGIMEVSRQYGVHPNSPRNWIRERKVDGFLLGGQWKIDPRSLAKFLEERESKRRKRATTV